MWTSEQRQKIEQRIDDLLAEMICMQTELTARPALGPTNGGTGEAEKCEYMREQFERLDLEVTEHRCPDPRVAFGYRPSLIGIMPGRRHDRTVWIMTHLDVVPPGSGELWKTGPYRVVSEGGKLFGRGVEDNQQEMVASFHALQALHDLNLVSEYDVGLVLAADEETGSRYGMDYVLKQDKRFRPEDLIIVADAGNDQGSEIEVAEKSIIWLKFTVIGRQTHGSEPHHGINAHRAGAQLLLRVDRLLHEKYPAQDPLFVPPTSTAEPTKKEANVPNINTIPGDDVFYFDCRILPQYSIGDLLEEVKAESQRFAQENNVQVSVSTEQMEQAAPPTSPDAPVVRMLSRAVKEIYGVETRTIGIGGGTVAAFFRRAGFSAAVWGRYGGAAHQPNEFCVIDYMVGDAKVYAWLLGLESQTTD